jgi:hypothetical protein
MFRDLVVLLACIVVAYFVVQTVLVGLTRFFGWIVNAGNE